MNSQETADIQRLRYFPVRFVAGKIILFLGMIGTILLLSYLQKHDVIATIGTYALLALALFQLIALFCWDFAPSIRCAKCGTRMRKKFIQSNSGLPSQRDGVLRCDDCGHTLPLGISTE